MESEDDPDDLDYEDQLQWGDGYDDGVPTSTPSPSDHRAPHTWAAVEALALVSADRCVQEHRVGEREREEREREGAPDPPPRRRGIFQ